MFAQLITPSPFIPCRPGWCLEYVRRTFGQPARFDTATEAWEGSPAQHRDRDFPAGCWVPVHYAVAGVPAGHIVLRAPDGSVYSTTHPTALTPVHHESLAALEMIYAAAGLPLAYRGWTEDIAGTPVIAPAGITAQGTTTKGKPMDPKQWEFVYAVLKSLSDNAATKTDVYGLKVWDQLQGNITGDRVINTLRADLGAMDPAVLVDLIPEPIAARVAELLAARLSA